MDAKKQTCCFSGHREIPKEELPCVAKRLKKTICHFIEIGYRTFCTGGALGFDTIAANVVLGLKGKYPNIKLALILPCLNQTRGWSRVDIQEYERIKASADSVIYVSETYYTGCMQKRNRALVDSSSVCICYLKKSSGGTAYTINYAERNSIQIVNIAN